MPEICYASAASQGDAAVVSAATGPRNQPRRVLLLLGELATGGGGIESFNASVLAALRGHGDGGAIVALNDPRRGSAPELTSGWSYYPCGGRHRRLAQLRFAGTAFACALRHRPLFVFCGHLNFLVLVRALRLLLGIRCVAMLYGIEAWSPRGRAIAWAMRGEAHYLAISRYTRDRCLAWAPLRAGQIGLLPCTFDARRFSPQPKSARLVRQYRLEGKRVLLTVARLSALERYKGHEQVLRALARLRSAHPELCYLIVGDGDYRPELQRRARELGVAEITIFAGRVPADELAAYYNLSDAFIMPSRGEGFGIVFLEALACGKPVIAGNGDGARDALLDGELGWLVDPEDSPAMARAILDALAPDQAEPRRNPAFLRRRTLEAFGPEAFSRRLLAALPC